MNLLKVPDSLPDKKVVLLSDILPTAWHANELGGVSKGDRVAIWGAGPGKCICRASACAVHVLMQPRWCIQTEVCDAIHSIFRGETGWKGRTGSMTVRRHSISLFCAHAHATF